MFEECLIKSRGKQIGNAKQPQVGIGLDWFGLLWSLAAVYLIKNPVMTMNWTKDMVKATVTVLGDAFIIKKYRIRYMRAPHMFFFSVKVWSKILKNFVVWVYYFCSYLQAYLVTISHLDTWFALVLLIINILTLLK